MPNEADTRRTLIDPQLQASGWTVQDRAEMNITASLGVAVREFPLATGFADYMLYADGRAIGVIEAKPEGHTLRGVETQSAKYATGLPGNLPHYHLPLPFAYESTGAITPGAGICPRYLLCVLKSFRFRRFVAGLNTGSLIQHMFTSQLTAFMFPLAPRAEQDALVAAVEQQLSTVNAVGGQCLRVSDYNSRLRQSILKRAFEGKLVPQVS